MLTGGGLMDGPKAKFQPMNVNFGLFPTRSKIWLLKKT